MLEIVTKEIAEQEAPIWQEYAERVAAAVFNGSYEEESGALREQLHAKLHELYLERNKL